MEEISSLFISLFLDFQNQPFVFKFCWFLYLISDVYIISIPLFIHFYISSFAPFYEVISAKLPS